MRLAPAIRYSRLRFRAIGAAGARFLHTEEVTGSIPVSPTRKSQPEGLIIGTDDQAIDYLSVIRPWDQPSTGIINGQDSAVWWQTQLATPKIN